MGLKEVYLIDGMVKEVAYMHEFKRSNFKLIGDVTDHPNDYSEAFVLANPRTIVEHTGNTVYLDRVKIPLANITIYKMEEITKQMIADFMEKHKNKKIYLITFKKPGEIDSYCRELEQPGFVEIRLMCRYDA